MYIHNTEAYLHNHSCRAKPRVTTYSGYVLVAFVIQHAKCLHHIILLSVACLVQPYFPTLSHKWYNFYKKVIEYEMCVFIFSPNLSETFIIKKEEFSELLS